jgi:uncharacterized SAM-binding protein YcdF (DUF218 family)
MVDGFDLKVLVRSLLAPPALPWLIVLLGLLVSVLPRRPRAQRLGLATVALGVVLAYFSAIGLVAAGLASVLERGLTRWEPDAQAALPAEAVVILGGGTFRADELTRARERQSRERLRSGTLQRVLEGARVARASGLPVLVSGGVPSGHERAEAHLMSEVLQQVFFQPVRWQEDRSRDTAENASFSARMLREHGVRRIILVTHAYHMPRARLAFEAAGLEVSPAPHDFLGRAPGQWRWRDLVPDASEAERIRRCLHEALGLVWYSLRGYL